MSDPALDSVARDARTRMARALDWLILFLTLGFGVLFVLYEVLVPQSAPGLMDRLDLGFTLAFLGALGLQLAVARDRRAWLRRNWVDPGLRGRMRRGGVRC